MTSGISRRNALTGTALLGVAIPTLAACGSDSDDPETAETPAQGAVLATTADVPEGGGAIFADAGVVVTQPTAGEFKGFTNICTHQKCPVTGVTATINCSCHGSQFSITDGSVVKGPAAAALAAVKLKVNGDNIETA